jgi:hypothetical protein
MFLRALERNSTLKTYWQNLANNDQSNILNFDENDTTATKDLIWKQTFKQHGYKILDKIDQLIMIMVTNISTTESNDTVLNENFHRIAESHVQYKIKQDHIDVKTTKIFSVNNFFLSLQVICESFSECIKNVVYQHGSDWTIKHAITWQKFLSLITNQFSSVTISSTTKSMS